MTDAEHEWLDDDAGPVVRPYTVSGGRTSHPGRFDLLAFVVTVQPDSSAQPVGGGSTEPLQPEHRRILTRAAEPVSVAELSGELDLALGVVRVLLADLVQAGLVTVHEPADANNRPQEHVLKAVINGLRAL